ncbi:hypothetical protein BVI2075_150075 [Burkholderia vietnamiensis]|nr:hypothetical protein BVI2075_150075 [Burkholderia vietnamiensis]
MAVEQGQHTACTVLECPVDEVEVNPAPVLTAQCVPQRRQEATQDLSGLLAALGVVTLNDGNFNGIDAREERSE